MKKTAFFLAAALILSAFAACAVRKTEPQPFLFYYKAADVSYGTDGLVQSEAAPDGMALTPEAVAALYFPGPQLETLVSPFPKGTELVSAQRKDGTLQLCLSKNFGSLYGADLSLALSCISLTFSQLSEIDAVAISAEDSLLGGQKEVTILSGSVLLEDNSLELAETTLNVYYSDGNRRFLIPQEVKTQLETIEERASYAISLLGQDPKTGTLLATLPENTEILDLSVENGLCIVDFSADFFYNRPETDAGERMTVLSIVDTLTDFDEIDSVQFYVEGEALTTYYHMDLSLLYERDEGAIGPVRASLNEIDASLFLLRKSDGALTEIPVRLKSTANESDPDTVLRALLEYGEKNGFRAPVPAESKVLSVTEDGSACHVDLSKAFASGLTDAESQKLAVQSIVSSLLALESVQSVAITIEGKQEGLSFVDLTKPFHS